MNILKYLDDKWRSQYLTSKNKAHVVYIVLKRAQQRGRLKTQTQTPATLLQTSVQLFMPLQHVTSETKQESPKW